MENDNKAFFIVLVFLLAAVMVISQFFLRVDANHQVNNLAPGEYLLIGGGQMIRFQYDGDMSDPGLFCGQMPLHE